MQSNEELEHLFRSLGSRYLFFLKKKNKKKNKGKGEGERSLTLHLSCRQSSSLPCGISPLSMDRHRQKRGQGAFNKGRADVGWRRDGLGQSRIPVIFRSLPELAYNLTYSFYRLSFKHNATRLGKNNHWKSHTPILRDLLVSIVKNTAKYYLMNFPKNQSIYADSLQNINNNHTLVPIH